MITVPAFAPPHAGVRHFFGTRHHAASLGVEPGVPIPHRTAGPGSTWLLSVKQVHGVDALVVDRSLSADDRFAGGWDALVTDQPGIMVAVRTADCVPVLLYDVRCRVVAAVHAGWRGTVAGIVPKTMRLLAGRFGTHISDLRVSIGPSAGLCCYEVDEPVLKELPAACAEWEKAVREYRGRKAYLDLKALIRLQAMQCGAGGDAVSTVNLCTICHDDLFFSYRRDGKVLGTMVSAIGLRAPR